MEGKWIGWEDLFHLAGGELADLVPAYITVHDRDFRLVHANRAFERDFPNYRGKACFELCRGLEAPCEGCELSTVFAEGKEASWEEKVYTSQGEGVYMMARAVPLWGEGGAARLAVKVACEVGELKRRVRQLEMSKSEYKALFNGVPCYISIQDRDYTIIRTNKYFEEAFGRCIGKKCYQVYGDEGGVCENCPVERTFQDGKVHSSEQCFRLASGETAQTIVYAAPIFDLKGEIFAAMEMSANITQVKRLQKELATLGQAVAVTAHSVKNILNGLKGGAYVVQSGLRKGDHQLAQQGWEMVKEGVEMISQFVSDVLVLSKKRVPERRPVHPAELAMTIWKLFHKRAQDLGIEFSMEADPSSLPSLMADVQAIHTALSNLVSNAIEACTEKKAKGPMRIHLRVRSSPRGQVVFEVEDTGVGIPKEIQKRLFQEVLSTKGSRGTGLGLLVTEKIVSEHGGALQFESWPGKGTIFRVLLPSSADRVELSGMMEEDQQGLTHWLLGEHG
jgi:signal transduction histidine kinase